mgnify:CR=1 FL=1
MIEARRRPWLYLRRRLAHRPVPEPVEHRLLDVRILERLGRDHRGGACRPSRWARTRAARSSARRRTAAFPGCARASAASAAPARWRSRGRWTRSARWRATADCCGRILSVIAGHDPRDHDSLPSARSSFPCPSPAKGARRLRVGRLDQRLPERRAGRARRVRRGAPPDRRARGRSSRTPILPDGPFEEAAELVILMEAAASFSEPVAIGPVRGARRIRTARSTATPAWSFRRWTTCSAARADVPATEDRRAVRSLRRDRRARTGQDRDALLGAAEAETATVRSTAGSRTRSRACAACRRSPSRAGSATTKLQLGIQFIGRALNDHAVIAAANLFQATYRLAHRSAAAAGTVSQ